VVEEHAEEPIESDIHGSRLDQRVVTRVELDAPGGEVFPDAAVRQDHGQNLMLPR
jgi:hypothetical protein